MMTLRIRQESRYYVSYDNVSIFNPLVALQHDLHPPRWFQNAIDMVFLDVAVFNFFDSEDDGCLDYDLKLAHMLARLN